MSATQGRGAEDACCLVRGPPTASSGALARLAPLLCDECLLVNVDHSGGAWCCLARGPGRRQRRRAPWPRLAPMLCDECFKWPLGSAVDRVSRCRSGAGADLLDVDQAIDALASSTRSAVTCVLHNVVP